MIRLYTQKLSTGVSSHRVLESVRFISQTGRILEKTPASQTPAESQSPTSQPPSDAAAAAAAAPTHPWQKRSQTRTLSNYDKRVLVWTGKYKSIDDVPPTTS